MYVAHVDLFIVLRYDVHAQASGVWPIVWPPARVSRVWPSVLQFSSVLETRLACKQNTIIPGPFAVGYFCGVAAAHSAFLYSLVGSSLLSLNLLC